MPDLSAARHTPIEAAVVSGHRALSHRLVIVVDNRQKAEEKKQDLLKTFAVASREVPYVHMHTSLSHFLSSELGYHIIHNVETKS